MDATPHTSTTGRAPLAALLRPAILIALAVFALRVLYLVFLCPYDLVEDEAQYWLWSTHLDWSYYSKGPGVAWAIAASNALFGDAEWAVRLPAAISGLVAMIAAAGLGAEAARAAGRTDALARRASLFALAAFALAPVFQMTAILMTIDGPLVASWLVAAWAAWRALMHRSALAWPALGLALAIGFLFKYTILLLPPGIIAFALLHPAALSLHSRWRTLATVASLLALLGLLPVLLWNADHDWHTVRHLLGHLGLAGGDMPSAAPGEPRSWNPLWPLTLIASQLGLAGPALALGVWCVMRIRRDALGAGAVFLAACALPILLFYLLVSLIAEPEGNWPIAGAPTLLILAGVWLSTPRVPAAKRRFSPRRLLWNLAILLGVCAAPVLLRADIVAAIATRTIERFNPDAAPIRTGRLIGARAMGEHAHRILTELDASAQRTDRAPAFVIVEHYGRASQLSYYLPDRRTVRCASAAMGGRKSQFDLWPHASLADPSLLGRDALLLSNDKPHTLAFWQSIFDSVTLIPKDKLDGEHKKDRVAYIGRGYRGLPPAPAEAAP